MPNKKHIHINSDGLEFYNDNGYRNVLNPNNDNTADFYNVMPTNGGALIATANTPTNGDTLQYDGSTGSWRSVAVSGGGGTGYTTVTKTIDEIVNQSTTLQNDNELFFTADANSTYLVTVTVNSPNDLGDSDGVRSAIYAPSNAVGTFVGNFNVGGSSADNIANYANLASGTTAAARHTTKSVTYQGQVRTTTSGAVGLKWAQWTSEDVNITVSAGSAISYIKIA